MLNTILVDTGPLTALFDKDDKHHHKILEFIKGKKFPGIKKIISIDSDFDVYRLPGKVRIENVFGKSAG